MLMGSGYKRGEGEGGVEGEREEWRGEREEWRGEEWRGEREGGWKGEGEEEN